MRNDPLPKPALLLAQVLRSIFGDACVAGSSVLAKYLCEFRRHNQNPVPKGLQRVLDRTSSNDIDMFVPGHGVNLKAGKVQYKSYWKDPTSDRTEILLSDIHDWMLGKHLMTLCFEKQNRTTEYSTFHSHIIEIVNLKIINVNSKVVCKNIQLIFVNNYPDPKGNWCLNVVHKFDINVCKCFIDLNVGLNNKPIIYSETWRITFAEGAKEAVHRGEFSMILRPKYTALKYMKRMYKYIRRGFTLSELNFHESCTLYHVQHITSKFIHCNAELLCRLTLMEAGFSDTLANQITQNGLLRMFDQDNSFTEQIKHFKRKLEISLATFNPTPYHTRMKEKELAATFLVRWARRHLPGRIQNEHIQDPPSAPVHQADMPQDDTTVTNEFPDTDSNHSWDEDRENDTDDSEEWHDTSDNDEKQDNDDNDSEEWYDTSDDDEDSNDHNSQSSEKDETMENDESWSDENTDLQKETTDDSNEWFDSDDDETDSSECKTQGSRDSGSDDMSYCYSTDYDSN